MLEAGWIIQAKREVEIFEAVDRLFTKKRSEIL